MEGADSTFALTEAKAGDGARPTSAGGTVVEDPRGMSMVHEQYGKLNEVVKNLNEKTKGLLMKERSEFLAAYRAHTYKVQRELKALRQRVAEEESSLQKDEKVKRLREDCEWYRREALQLDERTTVLKRELRELKEELEVFEDDRNWLVKQLKASKTQTELLRAALDSQRMAEESELAEPPSAFSPARGGGAPAGGAGLPPALQHLAKGGAVTLGPPANHLNTRFSNVASVPSFDGLRAKHSARAVNSLQRELTNMKRSLASERRAAQQLQLQISLRPQPGASPALSAGAPLEPGEPETAEAAFVQCITEVRARIDARKKAVKARNAKVKGGASEEGEWMDYADYAAAAARGSGGLGLDEFTAVDRVEVMQRLLAMPSIQDMVLEQTKLGTFEDLLEQGTMDEGEIYDEDAPVGEVVEEAA